MTNYNNKTSQIILNTILTLFCVIFFILPFILVISISFTSENEIIHGGFKIIPTEISLEGYKYVFSNPTRMINAYIITIAESFIGTFLSVLIMALCAYPLSRKTFTCRKVMMFFILFTMLFSGGLVPTYIVNTQILHLNDKFWIYILPSLVSAWYIIIIRTFFEQLPTSLIESAKLDGASQIKIFFSIILPLSKPVLATVSLLILLDKWNDWMTSLIYINNENYYTLQYLLQRILNEAEFIKELANTTNITLDSIQNLDVPTESMRFAMSIVAAGPMMFIFPFFQKYFVRGLTVGSVKS